jgi:hypothetical protein
VRVGRGRLDPGETRDIASGVALLREEEDEPLRLAAAAKSAEFGRRGRVRGSHGATLRPAERGCKPYGTRIFADLGETSRLSDDNRVILRSTTALGGREGERMPKDAGGKRVSTRVEVLEPEDLSEEERERIEAEDREDAEEDPQDRVDRAILAADLEQVRVAYGQAKLKYHAARLGIPGTGGHMRQHLEAVQEARRVVDGLLQLLEEGLPDPGDFLIATDLADVDAES